GDDGELQPFALVNAHEAHGIARADRRHDRLAFRALLRLDEMEEAEQSLALELVELAGQRGQALEVCAALLAPLLGEHPVRVSGFRQDGVQTTRQRNLPRQPPPAGVALEPSRRLAEQLGIVPLDL